MAFRIDTLSDGHCTTIRLIGQIRAEYLPDLAAQIRTGGSRIVLDLEEITPHIAGATDLTFHGTLNYIKQVLEAFAAGKKPKSVLNAPAHPRRLRR